MPADLFAFPEPHRIALPEGASPLLAAILLAIECAPSVESLATWWRDHQPALRRLTPAELATAIAAKDARKAGMDHIAPPAVVFPARSHPLHHAGSRLL